MFLTVNNPVDFIDKELLELSDFVTNWALAA
jgi:hypothetical protein